jgi:hypothetical protein
MPRPSHSSRFDYPKNIFLWHKKRNVSLKL